MKLIWQSEQGLEKRAVGALSSAHHPGCRQKRRGYVPRWARRQLLVCTTTLPPAPKRREQPCLEPPSRTPQARSLLRNGLVPRCSRRPAPRPLMASLKLVQSHCRGPVLIGQTRPKNSASLPFALCGKRSAQRTVSFSRVSTRNLIVAITAACSLCGKKDEKGNVSERNERFRLRV